MYSCVQGQRKKLQLSEITNKQGRLLQNIEEIGKAAVEFFNEQFRESGNNSDFSMLNLIPNLISAEENDRMTRLPDQFEVKKAVFELNGSSAAGPDGFTGLFFQKCWEIVAEDVRRGVRAFFCGQELPRFITHTNLVLIPKKDRPKIFLT